MRSHACAKIDWTVSAGAPALARGDTQWHLPGAAVHSYMYCKDRHQISNLHRQAPGRTGIGHRFLGSVQAVIVVFRLAGRRAPRYPSRHRTKRRGRTHPPPPITLSKTMSQCSISIYLVFFSRSFLATYKTRTFPATRRVNTYCTKTQAYSFTAPSSIARASELAVGVTPQNGRQKRFVFICT